MEKIPLFKPVSWYLVFAILLIACVAPGARAAMAPSEAVLAKGLDRAEDLQKVRQALEARMVRQRLASLGFGEGEITARLNAMDDHEIHQLAQRLDQLKAGGDGSGVVAALLAIAILAVILIWLLKHEVKIR